MAVNAQTIVKGDMNNDNELYKTRFIMKRITFALAVLTISLVAILPAKAQTQNNGNPENFGFSKIDVRKDFTENGFQWFRDAELVCAGNKYKHNAMTIGWGGIGTWLNYCPKDERSDNFF